MKFGYTILYVDSVEGTIAFYEKAFGLKRDMVVEGEFGPLATGATKLGFAAKRMLPVPALHSTPNDKPLALEIHWSPTTCRPRSTRPSPPAPNR
jgi:lactoylglutathione lyase